MTFLTEKLRGVPGVIQTERGMIAYAEGKLEEARAKGPPEIKKAEASVAMYRKRLAERERHQQLFEAYVAEVAQWASLRQPWELMSDEDWVELETRWGRRLEFPDFTGFYGDSGMRTLHDMMFKALPAIESEAFTVLPEDVRHLIRARRAPRPLWWFAAIELATHLREAEACDDMMFWSFGDSGVYQFWIKRDDLAARNWDAVKLTFECH